MDENMWTEDQLNVIGALSYNEGLQEIDTWYASQEEARRRSVEGHDGDGRFAVEVTQQDEFATLMDDIEQLTAAAAASDDIGEPTLNEHPHILANHGNQETIFSENLLESDTITESRETQQHQGGPETGISENLPENDKGGKSQETHQHTSEPELKSKMGSAPSLLKHSEADPPSSKQAQMLDPSPVPDYEMTPSADEDVPSSIGKSSMLEEMRTEEDEQNVKRRLLKVEVPKLELPDVKVNEDANAAEMPDSAVDVADEAISAISIQPKPSKIPQTRASQMTTTTHKDAQSRIAMKKQPTTVRRSTRLQTDNHSSVQADASTKNEERSSIVVPSKRKASDSTEALSGISAKNGKRMKNTKTPELSGGLGPAVSTDMRDAVHKRLPRNSLGGREIRQLTESPLLGTGVIVQGRSDVRQTRAQKDEAAKQAPNAARAAKERHGDND